MFEGVKLSGPPNPALYLVEEQQDFSLVTEPPQPAQELRD